MPWLIEANEKPGGETVQIAIGWTCLILGALLYIAQLISSIDFNLAQQLGIQENPEETDSILQTAERYTAWWDLFTLGWLPLAGLLMILESPFWPVSHTHTHTHTHTRTQHTHTHTHTHKHKGEKRRGREALRKGVRGRGSVA